MVRHATHNNIYIYRYCIIYYVLYVYASRPCSCRRAAVHDVSIQYYYIIYCVGLWRKFSRVYLPKVMQFIGLNLDIYKTGTR